MADEKWTHVKEIFDAVLQRKPEERSKFLDDACNGDDSVRFEVESLLSSFGRADGFMQTPVIDGTGEEPTIRRETFREGDLIGRYEVIRLLGSGGMGEVYLARDESLKRNAAIKVFSDSMASNNSNLERFIREAQSASALNHPRICTIYEIERDHDPPFIAMEYIDGETLSDRMIGETFDCSNAIEIALQIADGLAEAHDAGIVHRDIKPANILINKRGQVKIVDFGLAKMLSAGNDDETQRQISTSGTIVGTVSYMSPEQARGLPLDTRSDIWSFGVVLYEMLSGRLPFTGDTTSDKIAAILTAEPSSLQSDNGIVSNVLNEIVRKTLNKNKALRYRNVREVQADLVKLRAQLLRHDHHDVEVTEPRPDATTRIFAPATDQMRKAHRGIFANYKLVAGFVLLLGIIAVVFGVSYYRQLIAASPIDSIAVLPFTNDTDDPGSEYIGDGLTESLIGRLSQLPNLSVKARSTVFRYKGKDMGLKAIGNELAVPVILTGSVSRRDGRVALYVELVDSATENVVWKGEYDDTNETFAALPGRIAHDVSNKLRQKLTAAEAQQIARKYTENAEAYALYLKGRYYWDKRNEEAYKVAVDAYEQAIALDPNYALAYAGLADCYLFREVGLGRRVAMPKAKQYALKALEIDESLAEAHTTLAFVTMNYELNFPEGEKEFKRAIELKPNYAVAHQFYGTMLVATGRTEEGLAEMRKAAELEPYTVTINWSLGLGLTHARRYDQALAQIEKTLQIQPDHALAEGQLAGLYVHFGRYDEALAITRKHLANSERNLAASSSLAVIYIKTGRREEARAILNGLVDQPGQNANSGYHIAKVYAALGENDEAIRWLNIAYEERAFNVFFLRVDPAFDRLHGDPRFEELGRRIGLYI